MRRPVFCTDIRVADMTTASQPVDPTVGGESRLVRMRKIISNQLSKKRTNSGSEKTFAVPLQELVQRASGAGNGTTGGDVVPLVVRRICDYIQLRGLEQEGIFRVSGSSRIIDKLRSSFDRTGDANLDEAGDTMAAAGLLKQFLRELPDPVIPEGLHSQFVMVQEAYHTDHEELIRQLKRLVEQLPEENFNLLKYLMQFLVMVAQHEEQNRMGPGALGIVFGPNLFRVGDGIEGLREQAITNQIVTRFIMDFASIFEVDSSEEVVMKLANSPFLAMACDAAVKKIPPTRPPPPKLSSKQELELDTVNMDPMSQSCDSAMPTLTSASEIKASPSMPANVCSSPLNQPCKMETDAPRRQKTRRMESYASPSRGEKATQKRIHDEKVAPSVAMAVEESKTGDGALNNVGLDLRQDVASSHVTPDLRKSEWGKRYDDGAAYDGCEVRRAERMQQFQRTSSRNRRSLHKVRHCHSLDGMLRSDVEDIKEYSRPRSSSSGETTLHKPSNLIIQQSENSPSSSSSSFESVCNDGNRKNAAIAAEVPPLDLSKLHENVDSSEPVALNKMRSSWPLSRARSEDDDVLLSPRNSSLDMDSNENMDPNEPPSPPVMAEQSTTYRSSMRDDEAMDANVRHLTRKIQSLKRKIKSFEDHFEEQNGYRPSYSEKLSHGDIKKMMVELRKARQELKQTKSEVRLYGMAGAGAAACPIQAARESHRHHYSDHHHHHHHHNQTAEVQPVVEKLHGMEDSLSEMMSKLAEKRRVAHRPENVEEMDGTQVLDEKLAIQKALLHFENVHGRPSTRSEKELMKPIYERYRCVKRVVTKANSAKSKDGTELQPILEHETMDFTSQSTPNHSNEEDKEVSSVETSSNDNSVPKQERSAEKMDASAETSANEGQTDGFNFHELTHTELLEQQWRVSGEKRKLRRVLREFEEETQQRIGRRPHRDDRGSMGQVYQDYKQVKAKLRLLEALLSKHEHHYTV